MVLSPARASRAERRSRWRGRSCSCVLAFVPLRGADQQRLRQPRPRRRVTDRRARSRVVARRQAPRRHLVRRDLDDDAGRQGREARRQRAAGLGVERDPAWSPDGKSIAFSAEHRTASSTSGSRPRRAARRGASHRCPATSAGRRGRATGASSFRIAPPKGAWQLFVVTRPTRRRRGDEAHAGRRRRMAGPRSPDGKLVAFVSDREPEAGQRHGYLGARAAATARRTAARARVA